MLHPCNTAAAVGGLLGATGAGARAAAGGPLPAHGRALRFLLAWLSLAGGMCGFGLQATAVADLLQGLEFVEDESESSGAGAGACTVLSQTRHASIT